MDRFEQDVSFDSQDLKRSRVEIQLDDVELSPSKLKKPKSILSKRNLDEYDSDVSSVEKSISQKLDLVPRKSTTPKKKGCKSERMVRFHDDLEVEGGESSASSLSNEYGNKTQTKRGDDPQSNSAKSSDDKPGFFAQLFNFRQNLKFE